MADEAQADKPRPHHLIAYAIALVAVLALAVWWPVLPFGLLGGILFGLLLDGCMRPLLTRGWHRGWTLALILGLGLPLIGVVFWWSWPSISTQFNDFIQRLPSSWSGARAEVATWPGGDLLVQALEDLLRQVRNYSDSLGQITSWVGAIAQGAAFALLMLVLGIYLSISPQVYRRGLYSLTPARWRNRLPGLRDRLHHDLQRWLLAKLLAMSVIAVGSTLGLWLIGVPLALINGIIAGLLTFLPNFGPIASVIPPVVLALGQSPQLALWVVVLYAGLQAVESYLLTPLVMHRVVFIPPAMVLFAQLLMWTVFGYYGLIFAVPATLVLLDIAVYHREEMGESDGKIFEG
jgi:predicted PurR-regulated permease PerM